MSGAMRRFVTVAAALALVAAACNGKGKTTSPPTTFPGPAGVLRLGMTRPASLDPAQARTVEQLLLARQLFTTLSVFDPKSGGPVPALADWTASADQRQWDFKLRPGATFGNGRPVTADDVKYSLDRIAKKGSGSSVADELALVQGYSAVAVDGSAPGLAGVTVPAPDTVHIALDAPWSVLPDALSSPAFGIVPKEAVEAAAPAPAFADQPVGSGAFRVRSRTQDHLLLDRADTAKPQKDAVQTIDVSFFDSVAASYASFGKGQLDWSRVPPEEVEQAGRTYGTSAFTPYLAELFYGLNVKSPKFADARFREAVVRAIDRHGVVSAVYQSTARELDGVVGAGIIGHLDNACGQSCSHDVEAAKALVAQAFPPGGPPVPEVGIDYDDDPTQQRVAEAIKAGLAEAGIPAVLRPKPLADYETFAAGPDKELFRLPWIAPYASPDAFLGPLFTTGSRFNLIGVSSPDVDTPVAAARAEPDPSKRITSYQAAEQAVLRQAVIVPIGQFLVYAVASPRVRGLVPSVTGTFDGAAVTLAVRSSGK